MSKKETYNYRCTNHPDFFPDECGCFGNGVEKTPMKTPTPERSVEEIATVLTELIVIDYANYSGRESDNRGLFRQRTFDRIFATLQAERQKREEMVDEIAEINEENLKDLEGGVYGDFPTRDKVLIAYNRIKALTNPNNPE